MSDGIDLWHVEGVKILSRDAKLVGVATGSTYRCQLEGCGGERVTVKWPDGKHTHPCSKGLVAHKGKWRIG